MSGTALPLPMVLAAAAVTPLAAGVGVLFPETADGVEAALAGQVERQGRKFSKVETLYTPAPILPPVAWRYECGTCRFWQPSETSGNGFPACRIVGLPGDPFGGEAVHPLHWCGFWLNRRDDPPLRWLAEWLDPAAAPARGAL